jgi:diguanylate cyclase (GGDEF)-like protein
VLMRAVRVEQSRGAWTVIAVGMTLYGAGNLVWAFWLQGLPNPPIPSIADAMWLTLYPASYLGIILLARRHWRGVPAGVWLDGLVAGLGLAAAGAIVVFEPVLHSLTGSVGVAAVGLSYPICDLLLAALVVGVFALRGWRLDRSWALIGAGFLVLTVADSIYMLHVAHGATDASSVANLFYLAGVALIAFAAWQQPERSELPQTDGTSTLLVPGAFALAGLALLGYDQFGRLGVLPVALALLTVLAALLRTVLAFRDLRTFNEARRQAVTDDLTALPNRRLFQQRLEEAIARGDRAGDGMAVLIVDLDRFKELNDALGHHSGDQLLRQIGPRLSSLLRPVDTLARLGGDEFGVVIDAPANEMDALAVANRIRDVLAQPFVVQALALRVDASIGIALFPGHADTAGELLRRADVAMYQAKELRSGRELYAPERDTHSRDRLALAAELERALHGDEIEVYFQPKADARTREIAAVEALARWRHPVHGLLQPGDFIPLAETTGLIRSLTRRVMDLALAQCVAWRQDGFDLRVSVNVSVADLLDDNLPTQVAAALEHHQLPSTALVIEITESSVLTDPVRIHDVLSRLKQIGVLLALDDFGTGFSSLGHLKSLPVDEIKIDRSFVDQMTTNTADSAIVHATIQLAHRLGKRVVAEGVEDENTWQLLAAAGCHLIQGYALSCPLPPEQLQPLLAEFATRCSAATIVAATNAA